VLPSLALEREEHPGLDAVACRVAQDEEEWRPLVNLCGDQVFGEVGQAAALALVDVGVGRIGREELGPLGLEPLTLPIVGQEQVQVEHTFKLAGLGFAAGQGLGPYRVHGAIIGSPKIKVNKVLLMEKVITFVDSHVGKMVGWHRDTYSDMATRNPDSKNRDVGILYGDGR